MLRLFEIRWSRPLRRLCPIALALLVVGCEDFTTSGNSSIGQLSLSVCAERLEDGGLEVSAASSRILDGCNQARYPGQRGLRFTRGDRVIASSGGQEEQLYRRERSLIYRAQLSPTGDGAVTTAVQVRFERDHLPPEATSPDRLDVPQTPSFSVRQDGMRLDRNESIDIDWQASVSGGDATPALVVLSEDCTHDSGDFDIDASSATVIELDALEGSASVPLAEAMGLQFTETECTVQIRFRLGQKFTLTSTDTPFFRLTLDAQALATGMATVTLVGAASGADR